MCRHPVRPATCEPGARARRWPAWSSCLVGVLLAGACLVTSHRARAAEPAAAFLPAECPVYLRLAVSPTIHAATAQALWKSPAAPRAALKRWSDMLGPGLVKALAVNAKQADAFRGTIQAVVVAAGPGAKSWVAAARLSTPAAAQALLKQAHHNRLLQPVSLAGQPAFKALIPGWSVTIALKAPFLAVSLDPGLVQGFVQAPAKSLAKVAAFTSSAASPPAKGELWVYVDRTQADGLLAGLVGVKARAAYQKWQQALGLAAASTMLLGVSHGGPGPVTTVQWQWAKPVAYLQALAKPAPAPTVTAHVPRHVVSAVWVSLASGPAGVTALRTALVAAESAMPVKPVTTLVGQWEKLSGTPLKALVPRVREVCWVELANRPKTPAALRTVAVLKCGSPADAVALGKLLRQTAQKTTGKAPATQPKPGIPVWTWAGVKVQPAMTVHADRLVVGLDPESVRLVTNVAPAAALATDPVFVRHLKQLGAGAPMYVHARAGACFVSTPDLAPTLGLLQPNHPIGWSVRAEPNRLEIKATLPLDLLLLAVADRAIPR